MNIGLYRGAASLRAQQFRIDAIARNVANLSTAGYKRGTAAVTQFTVPGSGGVRRGVAAESATDFSQGDLRRTGQTYDFGLYGEGFFAAEGPNGEIYTRDGSFRVASDGVLLTAEGYPVAWTTINRQIDPRSDQPPQVDLEGNVRQGSDLIGRLKIVNFEDHQRLRSDGHGYFSAPSSLKEATATAEVHQGALEDSNALGVTEMIEMISAQRQFDSMVRTMKAIQESYSRLTRSA